MLNAGLNLANDSVPDTYFPIHFWQCQVCSGRNTLLTTWDMGVPGLVTNSILFCQLLQSRRLVKMSVLHKHTIIQVCEIRNDNLRRLDLQAGYNETFIKPPSSKNWSRNRYVSTRLQFERQAVGPSTQLLITTVFLHNQMQRYLIKVAHSKLCQINKNSAKKT